MASYDLIGLQTKVDVGNLIDYLQDGVFGRILQDGRIRAFDRELSIASFPVGIDVDYSSGRDRSGRASESAPTIRLLGVDRLDYTKGLPQKFRAFGRFLEKYPDYRRQVTLSQIAPPTRETMVAYADIRHELEMLSGSINGRYGELDWVPIQYIHRSTPRKMLFDVYRNSRIGFVTPLRDGMNLVAKEYVAAQNPEDPGVLILSRFAGAAEQMKEALIVNPYDVEEMADSIKVGARDGAHRTARAVRGIARGGAPPRHIRMVPLLPKCPRGRRDGAARWPFRRHRRTPRAKHCRRSSSHASPHACDPIEESCAASFATAHPATILRPPP